MNAGLKELETSGNAYPPVTERSERFWARWDSPDFYDQVIRPIGIAASAHGRDVSCYVERLWEANCTSLSKEELAGSGEALTDQAIGVISKNIRRELPLDLSLYYLSQDARLLLMPTIPEHTAVLFPEDLEDIKAKEYPEGILPFVVWLNQRETRPKYRDTKATTVFSRASRSVLNIGGLLSLKFGEELEVKEILEALGLKTPKEIYTSLGKLNELLSKYPGEIRFAITRTEGKTENEALYCLNYADEDESSLTSTTGGKDIKKLYPELKNLIDKSTPFERLAVIDPLGLDPDARMGKDADPSNSWEYFYTQLAIAQ